MVTKSKREISNFDLPGIKNDVETVIKKIKTYDKRLFELECHEQAIAHQIGCCLKRYFSDFDVDCEFNRRETVQKELPNSGKTDRVRLDIIIHRRETKENLLCIETKKHGRPKKEFDEVRIRLCELTKQPGNYEYKFGLLLTIKKVKPFIECEWFPNGNELPSGESPRREGARSPR